MNFHARNEQERMLFDIGTISFVLMDLTLYLDTHPYDREAMEYFNHYSRIRAGMMKDFASRYYPLTLSNAEGCSKEWTWGLAPAPWEGVC